MNTLVGLNTLNAIGNAMDKVNKALSNDFGIIGNWFHENVMVVYAKKYHYMYFGMMTCSQTDDFILNGITLLNSCEEKVLGVRMSIFKPHTKKRKSEYHFR